MDRLPHETVDQILNSLPPFPSRTRYDTLRAVRHVNKKLSARALTLLRWDVQVIRPSDDSKFALWLRKTTADELNKSMKRLCVVGRWPNCRGVALSQDRTARLEELQWATSNGIFHFVQALPAGLRSLFVPAQQVEVVREVDTPFIFPQLAALALHYTSLQRLDLTPFPFPSLRDQLESDNYNFQSLFSAIRQGPSSPKIRWYTFEDEPKYAISKFFWAYAKEIKARRIREKEAMEELEEKMQKTGL
ncbi:hypothetical protein JCM8547_002718 [Rhodosporidiobolus lusitaniae]